MRTKNKKKNQNAVALGRMGGLKRSRAKTIAVRENGKLGGRPKKVLEKISISEEPDGCWIWKGGLSARGYGMLISCVGGRNIGLAAHRIAYYLKHKHLPPEALVCHHCDVPRCVNPNHLFLGTQAQNQFDKVNKFRQAHSEAHGRSILTAEDVQQIRVLRHFLNTSLPKLSQMYGVGLYAIEAILTGVNWKHLPPPACLKK